MIGKKKNYRKVSIEFELQNNLVIPPEAQTQMKELFEGMAELFSNALLQREKIPTKYKIVFQE